MSSADPLRPTLPASKSYYCVHCRHSFRKEETGLTTVYCPRCRRALPTVPLSEPWLTRWKGPLTALLILALGAGALGIVFFEQIEKRLLSKFRKVLGGNQSLSTTGLSTKPTMTSTEGKPRPASVGSTNKVPITESSKPTPPTEPVQPTVSALPEVAQPFRPANSFKSYRGQPLPTVQVTTPGWVSFGQVLPPGQVREAVTIGSWPTQCDVKNRWPDGSIRFAVLTAEVRQAGRMSLQEVAPANSASFTPKVPLVAVLFEIAGTAYRAELPSEKTDNAWLTGPLVQEWRATLVPTSTTGQQHPFLRVLADVRCYRDGSARVDIACENTLDVPGASVLNYDVQVLLKNTPTFSHARVQHPYLTRWRQVVTTGGPFPTPVPNFEPIAQAKAVPRFLAGLKEVGYSTAGQAFEMLGRAGNQYADMGSPGGRPEIAPYPDWVAHCAVHARDDVKQYLLANGSLAGSWPIHIRTSMGNWVSLDEQPLFWLDHRAQVPSTPAQSRPKGNLQRIGSPLKPDIAHQPSLAYVPYLLTGDRYFADELAFWAHYVLVGTWPGDNNVRQGALFVHPGTSQQVRGMAWGLREVTDAASYLPDLEPTKAYFVRKLAQNLAWLDSYAESRQTPLGCSLARPAHRTYGNYLEIAPWQQAFLAWSLDHAQQQGFVGGSKLRERIVAFQLKLFTSEPDYPRALAAPYYPVVAKLRDDGKPEYFATIKEFYTENMLVKQLAQRQGENPFDREFASDYGMEARLALILAKKQNLAGADAALTYLESQIKESLKVRAGWAHAQE